MTFPNYAKVVKATPDPLERIKQMLNVKLKSARDSRDYAAREVARRRGLARQYAEQGNRPRQVAMNQWADRKQKVVADWDVAIAGHEEDLSAFDDGVRNTVAGIV